MRDQSFQLGHPGTVAAGFVFFLCHSWTHRIVIVPASATNIPCAYLCGPAVVQNSGQTDNRGINCRLALPASRRWGLSGAVDRLRLSLGAGASVGGWAWTTTSHESCPKNWEASMIPLVSHVPGVETGRWGRSGLEAIAVPGGFEFSHAGGCGSATFQVVAPDAGFAGPLGVYRAGSGQCHPHRS